MRALIPLAFIALATPAPGPAVVTAGAVQGTVELTAGQAAPRPELGRYARRRAVPPAAVARSGGLGDVVVYLVPETTPANLPRTAAPRVLQRDRTVLPYLTVARVGERVEFPNEDDVFHNLFSLSEPNRFDLGRYAPGEARTHAFRHTGAVRLFCDIHSGMAAVILVLDTPYHARPDADGTFRIEDVPPGRYTAIAWHDRAGADSVAITVSDGGTAPVHFALGT